MSHEEFVFYAFGASIFGLGLLITGVALKNSRAKRRLKRMEQRHGG